MNLNFEPKVTKETVVFQKETGNEIARFNGVHEIKGKDFEEYLPIEYFIVEKVETVINACVIEKKGKE